MFSVCCIGNLVRVAHVCNVQMTKEAHDIAATMGAFAVKRELQTLAGFREDAARKRQKRIKALARQQQKPQVETSLGNTMRSHTHSLATAQPQRDDTLVAPQASTRGISSFRPNGGDGGGASSQQPDVRGDDRLGH